MQDYGFNISDFREYLDKDNSISYQSTITTAREENILAGKTMIHLDASAVKQGALQRMNVVQATLIDLETKINRIGSVGMPMDLIEDYEQLKNLMSKIESAEAKVALG